MIGEFIQDHMTLVLFIVCVIFTILGIIGMDDSLKENSCIGYVCSGLTAIFAGASAVLIILVSIVDAIW